MPLGMEGRNSEWNKSVPIQAVCVSQDTHLLDYLAQLLNPHSFKQSTVLPQSLQAARNQENKMSHCPSRDSRAAQGARTRLGAQTKAAGPIHISTELVSLSSDTVATFHYLRLFQREQKQ